MSNDLRNLCYSHILCCTVNDCLSTIIVAHPYLRGNNNNTTEDDEFEEFDPAHWNKDAMDEETQQQWMENWDEAMDDDFTQNLREELQKSSK